MSKGILIFAYNNKINYLDVATVAAKLAKQQLSLPVTLVTNTTDINNETVFDSIVVQQLTGPSSKRMIKYSNGSDLIEWHNTNRSNAYDLSPYDQTLLIDADYLMFNNSLGKLFETNLEFACYDSVHEINGWSGLQDNARVGYPGIRMQWATVVYFTKNILSKSIFDFMGVIKENYDYYSSAYDFTKELFRNDFTLSIALQALTGYKGKNFTAIPGNLITANTEVDLVEVRDNRELVFTWKGKENNLKVTKIKDTNIHIMNKKSITDQEILQKLLAIT
jgi:hypothetical protein